MLIFILTISLEKEEFAIAEGKNWYDYCIDMFLCFFIYFIIDSSFNKVPSNWTCFYSLNIIFSFQWQI